MSKKIIISIVLVFVAVAAGIVWRQTRPVLAPKYTGPVKKIVIGNLGIYSIFNLIAQEKGYFKENGIDVEIKEYDAGPPMIVDLLGGKLNFTVAGEFPGVSYMFTNNNLRILGEVDKQKVTEVIGRKDKGISSPADLKGKKIGLTRKSAGEIFFGQFLTSNNLTFSDVNIVDLSPSEMIDQITTGKIDAMAAYEPFPFQIKKKLGDNAIYWNAQGDQDTYALLYSTDEFIKSKPQIVKRYMQSLIEAEQYVKDHNVEEESLISRILHYDDAYTTYIWPKVSFSIVLEQALLLAMEDEARFSIANKLTNQTKVPNYLNFIYFDTLTKVKPEAVTIIH